MKLEPALSGAFGQLDASPNMTCCFRSCVRHHRSLAFFSHLTGFARALLVRRWFGSPHDILESKSKQSQRQQHPPAAAAASPPAAAASPYATPPQLASSSSGEVWSSAPGKKKAAIKTEVHPAVPCDRRNDHNQRPDFWTLWLLCGCHSGRKE